ncbi:hypothetical protein HMPREF0204_10827, partial [Chryseobacterium gleum ATCC 35910]
LKALDCREKNFKHLFGGLGWRVGVYESLSVGGFEGGRKRMDTGCGGTGCGVGH